MSPVGENWARGSGEEILRVTKGPDLLSTITVPPALCQAFPDPIPGIIPFATLTLFAGASGVGKTAMLADWCQRWRTGRTICQKPTNPPTGFYYLAADRAWKSHQQWFDLAGFSEIPHYSLADDRTLDLLRLKDSGAAYSLLIECLNKLNPQPGGHVFLDPMAPLFIDGDQNRSRDVAASLLRLSRVIHDRQLNMTAVVHFGKQKGNKDDNYARPQDRISGSGSFAGFSDTQIYLVDSDEKGGPHTLGWNPRHSPAETFSFIRNKEGLFVPHDAFTEIDGQEKIFDCVPEQEPIAAIAILKRAHDRHGFRSAQAERYIRTLVQAGRLVRVRRGVYQRPTTH